MKPRLCVDFDGVIFDGTGLIPDCVASLRKLQQTFSIAIYSARVTEAERDHMKYMLGHLGVPYDEILDRKPEAYAYIDDKAIQFTSWAAVSVS